MSRCSIVVGVGSINARIIPTKWRLPSFTCELLRFNSRSGAVVIVGNNEQPFPPVRGSDIAGANSEPLRIVPERGNIPKHSREPPSSEHCDVLHDDVAGL